MDKKEMILRNLDMLSDVELNGIAEKIAFHTFEKKYGIKMTPWKVNDTRLFLNPTCDVDDIAQQCTTWLKKKGLDMDDLRLWQSYVTVFKGAHLYQKDINLFHGDTKMKRVIVDFFLWVSDGKVREDMSEAGRILDQYPTYMGVEIQVGEIVIKLYNNGHIRIIRGMDKEKQDRLIRIAKVKRELI